MGGAATLIGTDQSEPHPGTEGQALHCTLTAPGAQPVCPEDTGTLRVPGIHFMRVPPD